MTQREHAAKKHVVGMLASRLVQNGMTAFIDSSSTCLDFAMQLPQGISARVLTNAVPVAQELATRPDVHVELAGGTYDSQYQSLFGRTVVDLVASRHADLCFLSCMGMSAEAGFTVSSDVDIDIKQAMRRNARALVMLMDSTKFGETYYYCVFDWDEVDVLVCDELPGEDLLARCRDHHVRLVTPRMQER